MKITEEVREIKEILSFKIAIVANKIVIDTLKNELGDTLSGLAS